MGRVSGIAHHLGTLPEVDCNSRTSLGARRVEPLIVRKRCIAQKTSIGHRENSCLSGREKSE